MHTAVTGVSRIGRLDTIRCYTIGMLLKKTASAYPDSLEECVSSVKSSLGKSVSAILRVQIGVNKIRYLPCGFALGNCSLQGTRRLGGNV